MSHLINSPTVVDRIIDILNDDEKKHSLVGNHVLRSNGILQTIQRDKQELQNLNISLDGFVRKLRDLGDQNRNLVNLTQNHERELTAMKEKFHQDINYYEKKVDLAVESNSKLEIQIERLRSELNEYKTRFNLSDNGTDEDIGTYAEELDVELRNHQRQLESDLQKVESLQREIQGLNTENSRLVAELQQVYAELDREKIKRLQNKNLLHFLEKKNTFLHKLEDEFDDRQTGLRAVYSKVVDCRQIAASIREIHGEFNDCIIENRSHLDWLRNVKINTVNHGLRDVFNDEKDRVKSEIERYREKVRLSEIENDRLKQNCAEFKLKVETERTKYVEELTQLELKLKSLINENVPLQNILKVLINDNHSLKAELAIYKKMVGAQVTVRAATQQPPHSSVQPSDTNFTRGEMTVHTIYIRESLAGCHIRFGEVPYDGKFIVLENLGDNDEVMDSWKIVQSDTGTEWKKLFVFPPGYTLKAHTSTEKIWNMNQGTSSPYQFQGTWDGRTSTTINLLDKNETVKASYKHSIRKTTRDL